MPWCTVPLLGRRGDVFLMNSRLIHAGGTCPSGVDIRYVAFAAAGTVKYDYNLTMPVATPSWACRPRGACNMCAAPATTTCFACGRLVVCEGHAEEDCAVCRGLATQAVLPVGGHFRLPTAHTLVIPGPTTRLFLTASVAGGLIKLPFEPLARRFTPDCPLADYLHEDALVGPNMGILVHLGPGQVVMVRDGAVGGVAYCPAGEASASLWRFELVPNGLYDPGALALEGLLKRQQAARGSSSRKGRKDKAVIDGGSDGERWHCACEQVCTPLGPRWAHQKGFLVQVCRLFW